MTTLIIIIGLIPLIFLQDKIVAVLNPISPYVIPAIFGGLTMILIAQYWKIAAIPFVVCIGIAVVSHYIPMGEGHYLSEKLNQSTMVIVGMVVSGISTTILYKLKKI